MDSTQECILGATRVRRVFKYAGFGIILLWILFGSYGPGQDLTNDLEQPRDGALVTGRNLLSVNFSTNPKEDTFECSKIHELPDHQKRNQTVLCEFVRTVPACGNEGGFIPYFEIVYCYMPLKLIPLSMVLLFFWLLFLFVFLGTTAEEYFCPALTVISQILRLSQNVAGVTLLAFGNGAPDIFSALAAINQPDIKRASLAFGALFGAGMFVTTIVVGAVAISKPFTLTRRPYMRDIVFYISAVYWTFFVLWNNKMDIYNAVGFILLYLVYVTVVILGRLIYQKWKKRLLGTGDIPKPVPKPNGTELLKSTTTSQTRPEPHPLPYPQANGGICVLDTSNNENSPSSTGDMGQQNGERPTIIVIPSGDKDDNHIEEHHDHHDRPGTPRSRCASHASHTAYGTSDDEAVDHVPEPHHAARDHDHTDQDHHVRHRPVSPAASPLTMKKTITNALDVTEGVGVAVLGSNPNLSKIWHHAYRRELVHENRSRDHTPALGRRSPLLASHSPMNRRSPFGSHSALNRHGASAHNHLKVSDNIHSIERDGLISSTEDEEDDPLIAEYEEPAKKKVHPFLKLLIALWPFGEEFRALKIWGKAYEIVKIPAGLVLTITVPVIDRDEDDHNWNRWLNILHCVSAPLFICLTTNVGFKLIGGVFPVAIIVLVFGVALAIVVAFTSSNEKPPVYHCVFAWAGFLVAIIWIYSIANEVVNVLQVFGVVIDISDGILGITLLAWGNSIGDAVANVTMARQGFPRMAVGACFGGPLLNMLLGIGLASTLKCIKSGLKFELYFTQVQLLASLFLLFSLTSALVITSCLRFKMRRIYGIFLLCLYVVFLIVVILAETKIFMINIPNVLSPF